MSMSELFRQREIEKEYPPVTAYPHSPPGFSRTHRDRRPGNSSHLAPASIVPDEEGPGLFDDIQGR
jgi:hypothetical protein